jgi:hypothetical protein
MIKTLLLSATLLLFSGCFSIKGKKVKRSSNAPTSHQVQYIESHGEREVMLRATGVGETIESAIDDARKASIWSAIFGKNGVINSGKEQKRFKSVANTIYENSRNYITYESPDIKGKSKTGDNYSITKIFKVDRQLLKDDLTEAGVLDEIDEVSESLQNPSISIISFDGSSLFEHGSTVLLDFLSSRGFNAVVSGKKRIDSLLDKSLLMTGDLDPNYKLAVQTGSDIYISLATTVSERSKHGSKFYKATVSAKAYSTVTKKLLASATGYSQEVETSNRKILVEEAVNDLSDSITSKIAKKWKKSLKKGREFRVIVKSSIPEADRSVRSALKAGGSTAIKIKSGTTVFDFSFRNKSAEAIEDILDILENNYNGVGKIHREFSQGSLLVLKISSGEAGDDEIIIE